jgi:hypothetical protein
MDLSRETQTEIEAATFRRFLAHLDENKDVQNIDLMILANFCRNCISKWYSEEAGSRGAALDNERNYLWHAVYRMEAKVSARSD